MFFFFKLALSLLMLLKGLHLYQCWSYGWCLDKL